MIGLILTLVFLVAGLFAWHSMDLYLALCLFALSAAFYFCWQIAAINTTIKTLKDKKEETK